jgi:hypothetical protein
MHDAYTPIFFAGFGIGEAEFWARVRAHGNQRGGWLELLLTPWGQTGYICSACEDYTECPGGNKWAFHMSDWLYWLSACCNL